jgi:MinD-like ATPase involved in chromosome partitioning or flagellar assembly
LLEADLAAPELADALGLSRSPGLHEFLLGEAEPPQILQALVLAGPASAPAVEPLACIVAGGPGSASVPLLASERCRHAIERLRTAYDLLVIDGPGLDRGPDGVRELAGLVDTTIACGGRREIPRRLPVPVAGLVISD